MLDPKLIRGDLPMLAGQLARRQFVLDVEVLSDLEAKRKSAQTAMETLQAERNRVSKAIGQAKAKAKTQRPLWQRSLIWGLNWIIRKSFSMTPRKRCKPSS